MMRVCPFCHIRAFIDTQCPICGAHIEEIRDAEEALEEMHRKYIDVICPQCGKTVSSGQLILIGPGPPVQLLRKGHEPVGMAALQEEGGQDMTYDQENYRTIIEFQQEQYENMLMGKIPTVAKKKTVALKPCPFCGGIAVKAVCHKNPHNYDGAEFWVVCVKCHIKTNRSLDEDKPVESWNRRVGE